MTKHEISYHYITVDTSGKTVGPQEFSGYVHAYNDEPITFIPGNPHKNERPVNITNISHSRTKNFLPVNTAKYDIFWKKFLSAVFISSFINDFTDFTFRISIKVNIRCYN
jgi:hypothetical protein